MAVYQSRWQLCQGRPAYGRFIKNGRCVKIEEQASGRNGRFINQKRANAQICRFGLRMVDFILSRTSSLSTARSSLFRKSWQSSGRFIRPASRNGRFIKASLFESFLQAPHKASSKFSSKAPLKLLTKLLIQLLKLLTKLLIQLLFKLLTKLLLKLLIKLLLKLRIRSLDKVHKEDSAVR